ncbi:hypothetical protein SNE40_023416 [Patella caerulea]|uniref:Uncharacterized protein n=1 Tax=Patella caerulea TaxID=87958 RepID=A0AAN8GC16_PATCE
MASWGDRIKLRTFGFGFRAFKNYPELVPLCAFISAAVVGACSMMAYSLKTKPDVRLIKSSELPPWERVKPTEVRKFYVNNDKKVYVENEQLAQLRKEIGSFKC